MAGCAGWRLGPHWRGRRADELALQELGDERVALAGRMGVVSDQVPATGQRGAGSDSIRRPAKGARPPLRADVRQVGRSLPGQVGDTAESIGDAAARRGSQHPLQLAPHREHSDAEVGGGLLHDGRKRPLLSELRNQLLVS